MTLFEKIISREIPAEIVHEDDLCIAFRDIKPAAPVHILIVPKKPIPRLGEAEEGDRDILGHLLLAASAIAEKLGIRSTAKGFRLVVNHGKDGGEEIPHLHIHMLAGRRLGWPPG